MVTLHAQTAALGARVKARGPQLAGVHGGAQASRAAGRSRRDLATRQQLAVLAAGEGRVVRDVEGHLRRESGCRAVS